MKKPRVGAGSNSRPSPRRMAQADSDDSTDCTSPTVLKPPYNCIENLLIRLRSLETALRESVAFT
jgi:hypothetical protein